MALKKISIFVFSVLISNTAISYDATGIASWYGDQFHLRKTANGETFDKDQFSAAHRTLPLKSIVKVTNLKTGKSIKVMINDRGPYHNSRIIDLSEQAAKAIGMKNTGVAKVRVTLLPGETEYSKLGVKAMEDFQEDANVLEDNVLKTQRYLIHVGTYNNIDDAKKVVSKLSKFGYAKSFKAEKSKNYNVHFASASGSPKHTIQMLDKIIKLGYPNAILAYNKSANSVTYE